MAILDTLGSPIPKSQKAFDKLAKKNYFNYLLGKHEEKWKISYHLHKIIM